MGLSKRGASLKAHLDAKPGATAHPVPAPRGGSLDAFMFKVMGKMFAVFSTRGEAFVILKSDPHLIEILKEKYDGVGHRSHLDRRFWIAVDIDADVPLKEIKRLADKSYELVCASLTRKQQAELGRSIP